jgi:hypothetical protein
MTAAIALDSKPSLTVDWHLPKLSAGGRTHVIQTRGEIVRAAKCKQSHWNSRKGGVNGCMRVWIGLSVIYVIALLLLRKIYVRGKRAARSAEIEDRRQFWGKKPRVNNPDRPAA